MNIEWTTNPLKENTKHSLTIDTEGDCESCNKQIDEHSISYDNIVALHKALVETERLSKQLSKAFVGLNDKLEWTRIYKSASKAKYSALSIERTVNMELNQ